MGSRKADWNKRKVKNEIKEQIIHKADKDADGKHEEEQASMHGKPREPRPWM